MMKHGADIYSYAKKMKCSPAEVVDFSSNINFVEPKIKIKNLNLVVSKYADSSYSALKNAISKSYNIDIEKMALYNGASSAIFSLVKHLKTKKVYLYSPLYSEYEKAIPKKRKIIKINRFKNLYEVPAEGSTVIFSNPSTPEGKYYNLQKLFKIWKKQKCKVILDESFLEFENLKSYGKDIDSYEDLYIIQSFSKFYSCGGVRIGAIFSNKKNIKKLQTPIWNLSSFDVAILTQRLKDIKFKIKSQKQHNTNKEYLKDILQRSNLFEEIFESDSNFYLTKSKRASKIFNYLLKHKILVRSCESFDYLDESYLRFAVKNKKDLNLLAKVLEVKYKWYEKPLNQILHTIEKLKPKKDNI